MKKTTLFAFFAVLALFGAAGLAHAAHAADAPVGGNAVTVTYESAPTLSAANAQQLKLVLDTTGLVLNQIQVNITAAAPAPLPDAPIVNAELSAMKTFLVGVNGTLVRMQTATAVYTPPSPVASRPAGSVQGASAVSPAGQQASSEVFAQQSSGDVSQSSDVTVADKEANDLSTKLASVSSTLKSKKVVWPAIIVLVVLLLVIGFFVRRKRRGSRTVAASSSSSASPVTPASV